MRAPKKLTILIVDDDKWLAEQHAQVLQQAGYNVYLSPHALAAIEHIDEVKPDVLLLDILLPGATGFSLLQELQSYRDTATIPVIVCSGVAETLDIEELKPYGVRRLLDKAVMTPDDIVAAVRSVLI